MKRILSAAIAMLLLSGPAGWAGGARRDLTEGTELYGKGQFDKAAEAFERAADAADTEKLDPAVANYNRANALMNQGKPDEASRYYQESLRTTDLELQKKSYFNRGNALMAMAEPSEQEGQLDAAKKAVEEAINMYVGAMTLDPGDNDPKVNFELAVHKKQELEQKQQEQQQQQQQQDQNDEKKEDEQKDQQQKQDQDQKKQDQQNQEQQKQEQEKQDQADQQEDEKKEEQQQAQPAKAEDMTQEEAMQLLDALKQQEQADREKIRVSVGAPVSVEKDW